MEYHLIINPKSGKGKTEEAIKLVKKRFSDRKQKLTVTRTTKAGHAKTLARKSKADVIIAAGGDGTVNEIVNGLVGKKGKTLALLPVGTANMLARYLRVPINLEDAIDCIFEHNEQILDVGTVNGHCFTLAAGIGMDAHLFDSVKPGMKKMIGPAVYPLSGIRSMFEYEPKKIIVKTPDLELEGYFVVICNVGKYSEALHIAPHARIDDGLLDVVIFEKKQVRNFLKFALGVVGKYHGLMKDVKRIQTKQMSITTETPVLIQADAEIIGTTPAVVEVKPAFVKVLRGSKTAMFDMDALDSIASNVRKVVSQTVKKVTLPHQTKIFKKVKKTRDSIAKRVKRG